MSTHWTSLLINELIVSSLKWSYDFLVQSMSPSLKFKYPYILSFDCNSFASSRSFKSYYNSVRKLNLIWTCVSNCMSTQMAILRFVKAVEYYQINWTFKQVPVRWSRVAYAAWGANYHTWLPRVCWGIMQPLNDNMTTRVLCPYLHLC